MLCSTGMKLSHEDNHRRESCFTGGEISSSRCNTTRWRCIVPDIPSPIPLSFLFFPKTVGSHTTCSFHQTLRCRAQPRVTYLCEVCCCAGNAGGLPRTLGKYRLQFDSNCFLPGVSEITYKGKQSERKHSALSAFHIRSTPCHPPPFFFFFNTPLDVVQLSI